jgi:Putative Flp pilus-assembly TadE/G-like
MLKPRARVGERGAVLVMVAILIVPIMLFAAFAVDVGHWWVHERHLQTQADAGVLAGALGPWLPTCDETAIEGNARQYASDLGTGFNPQYTNEANVHALLNSSDFWNNGGSDFSDGGTPCDLLANATEDDPAFLDVKATESNLSNFFGSLPGFSVVPAINAHARVEVQAQSGGEGIKPIAVRDDTAYQCAEIHRYSSASGAEILPVITLARTAGPPATAYTEFQNTVAAPITMPSTDDGIYVRVKLYANRDLSTGSCTGPGDEFPTDDNGAPVGGVNFVNVYSGGSNPTPSDPFIRGVQLLNGTCAPDQYFSTNACAGSASAIVEFASGAITSGVNKNVFVTIDGADATNGGGNVWTAPFSFSAKTGPHPMTVVALQRFGSTSKGNCNNPNRCKFDFGVRQQTYSATDDDGEPSSSGPISMVQIGEGGGGVGANSFERNTTHNLVFTVRLAGLQNSLPTDPPVVLRYRTQGSKRTGLVDCGQGNGANADEDAIINGCPRALYIWPTGTTCVTPTNSAAPTPIDCVGNTPGNRTAKIPGAIRTRVGNACNNWNAYRDSNGATTFPPGDPRMMTFIITSPVDLSGGGGSKPDIPIILFATFYVTGADRMTGNGSGCQNEPYPGPGNKDQAAVWGHWIKWASPGGSGNGKGCIPNQFGACVAVLTQ